MIDIEIQEGFKTIKDGKDLIAKAITEKGIKANGTDTFPTLAEKINKIEGGGSEVNPTLCFKYSTIRDSQNYSYYYDYVLIEGTNNEFKPGPKPADFPEGAPSFIGLTLRGYLDNYNFKGNANINYKIEYKIPTGINILDKINVFYVPNIGIVPSGGSYPPYLDDLIADGEWHEIDLGIYANNGSPFSSVYSDYRWNYYYSTSNLVKSEENRMTFGEWLDYKGYSRELAGNGNLQNFYISYKNGIDPNDYPIYIRFEIYEEG